MIILNVCCHFRDLPEVANASMLSSKDFLTILISSFAAIIALYTLWGTHLKPYVLTVCPPTILQANDPYPSLILTFSFHNSGARSALINNLRIRTFNNAVPQELELKVQRELTQFQTGILPLDERNDIAWFVPFIVKGKESEIKRLYFCPMKGAPISYAEVLQTNRIDIDIAINNKWFNSIFTLNYNEFIQKFRADGTLIIPNNGFGPIFFHGTTPSVTISKLILKLYRIIKK
jgi:hypothetical protein